MRFWQQLRQPDWLAELQAVLVAGLVLAGLGGGLLALAWVDDGSVYVELSASAVTGSLEYGLEEGAAIAPEQELLVEVAEPSVGQQVSYALTKLPTFAVVVALLALLLWIVRQARRSDPFTHATVRRLRVLAWVALVAGVAANLVELFAAFYLAGTASRPEVAFSPVPVLMWLLVGFVVLAVAEVVRRGCALRDELDTVV